MSNNIQSKIEATRRRFYSLEAERENLEKEVAKLESKLKQEGYDSGDIDSTIKSLKKKIKKNEDIIQEQLEKLENEFKNL